MNHHSARFRRGFNKIRALAASSFPRSQSQPNCSRLYPFGTASTTITDVSYDYDDASGTDTEQYVSIMGKSNKFDYTNRASSGAKLGLIIGRDLEKEADKARKDADKQASKTTRKTSVGSATSYVSSDTRDSIVHVLDIKVPSKQLGDEGACAMAEGLEIALRKGTNEASVLLEDLNLFDNAITTVSLARLAPIIVLARHDLKTINLANNTIKVETAEEAEQWETFLRAFAGCLKLRRLDLSGNVKLGAKAMEVLAGVYTAEKPINPIPACGETSVYSIVSETEYEDQDTPKAPTHDPMISGKFLKRRCGLRSIPYITLSNTGLTDAGALWLSYVLVEHHYPSQMIDELNATHADSTIKTYQQSSNSNGLDCDQNEDSLTRDGRFLLDKAQKFRLQTILADELSVGTIDDFEMDQGLGHRHPRVPPGYRRSSVRSITSEDGGEHEQNELDRARKRVQRSIIELQGASSVDLWRAGMRTAVSACVLSGLGATVRVSKCIYTGPPMFDFSSSRPSNNKKPVSRPTTPMHSRKDSRKISTDSAMTSPSLSLRQGTYAQSLTANTGAVAGEPEAAITDVTNTPTTPKLVFKSHRKEAFSDGGDLLSQKLNALAVRTNDSSPQRFVRWQQVRVQQHGARAFRDFRIPSHLPNSVLQRIARETLSSREREALSETQCERAVLWARQRSNLALQREWWKNSDSVQVWSLLERIGCLAYDRA